MYALSDLLLPEIEPRLQRAVLDQVRHRTLTTCQQLGIIRDDRMSLRKYLAGRFELLVALAYPDADVDALTLCNDFDTYLFYVDDQADEDIARAARSEGLRDYFESHVSALRDGSPAAGDDPAAALLLVIRERLLERASQAWLTRFSADVEDYLIKGTLVGAQRWAAGAVPSFDEYVEQRAWDSAVLCAQDLIEVAGGGELPEGVHERFEFRELRRLCTNVAAFTNDLVSYSKEVRNHQSPNNLVHVVMTHEQRTLEAAFERVIELINRDVAAFEEIAAGLQRFDRETDARLERYLRSQRAWMGGNLLWSLASGRYMDPQSPFVELRHDPAVHMPAEYRALAGHATVMR